MFVLVLVALIPGVLGHGYLQEPPSRSSMWRFGFNTPPNYNDNQLFCGGFDVSVCNSTTTILSLDLFLLILPVYILLFYELQRQWNRNGGKCGICGDPWDGVRENEAGGRYATGTISRQYTEGQVIDVRLTPLLLFFSQKKYILQLSPCLKKFNNSIDSYFLS